MFDFGALPPEVNSARMYAGPGAAPMMAAAGAWSSLAAELSSTAAGFAQTRAELALHWQGESSAVMAAAVDPYTAWMSQTALQAQQTADQMLAAVSAYEAAFAATVPPPAIEANRTLLTSLIATNFLGQNTPAIAAAEALYAEMWAQDASAMYGYAGSSLATTRLTPFSEPPRTGQEPAPAAAAGNAQLTSAITQQLHTLASGGAAKSGAAPASSSDLLTSLVSPVKDLNTLLGPLTPMWQVTYSATQMVRFVYAAKADLETGAAAGQLAKTAPNTLVSAGVSQPVRAGMGRSSTVGGLSVPQTLAPAHPMAGAAGEWSPRGSGLRVLPPWADTAPMERAAGGTPMVPPGMRNSGSEPAAKQVLRMRNNRFSMPRPSAGG